MFKTKTSLPPEPDITALFIPSNKLLTAVLRRVLQIKMYRNQTIQKRSVISNALKLIFGTELEYHYLLIEAFGKGSIEVKSIVTE